MNTTNIQNLPIHLGVSASKDNNKKPDEVVFYEFFLTHITSVYDFEKQTGISRADGCRYKNKYEDLGLLQIIRLGICPVKGAKDVQMVTTNKNWFKKQIPTQLNMFEQ